MNGGAICADTRPWSSLDVKQVDAEVLDHRDALAGDPFEVGVTEDSGRIGRARMNPLRCTTHLVTPREVEARGWKPVEKAVTNCYINIRIQQFPSGTQAVRTGRGAIRISGTARGVTTHDPRAKRISRPRRFGHARR